MFFDHAGSLDNNVLTVKTIDVPGLSYRALMDEYHLKIPEILRDLVRDKANGNQNEAARKTKFHQRTIGRWLNGETSPSIVEFCVFCEKLGVKPWDALAADEKAKRDGAIAKLKQAAEDVQKYI